MNEFPTSKTSQANSEAEAEKAFDDALKNGDIDFSQGDTIETHVNSIDEQK